MIRTTNNVVRTLLFQAKLPPSFWTEALNTANHLLNIRPSRVIGNFTPFFVWIILKKMESFFWFETIFKKRKLKHKKEKVKQKNGKQKIKPKKKIEKENKKENIKTKREKKTK